MLKWIVVGAVLQTGMVLVGHGVEAVANLFGPLGVTISLVVSLLWSREGAEGYRHGAWGGAVVGGVAALIGIAVSFLLGDVDAVILAFGTLSSAATGALGGLGGWRLRAGRSGLGARGRTALLILLAAAAAGSAPDAAAAQQGGPEHASADGGLEAFAWLTGSWEGEGPGGTSAGIHFMPAEGGVMPAVFHLWKGERSIVLEAMTLVREEDRVVMYVRHFDPSLVPMEKERAIELVLVDRRGDAWLFENAIAGQNPRRSTLTRTPDGFASVSELVRPDGSMDEIRSSYRRAPDG